MQLQNNSAWCMSFIAMFNVATPTSFKMATPPIMCNIFIVAALGALINCLQLTYYTPSLETMSGGSFKLIC
jgi:hypothetical protein